MIRELKTTYPEIEFKQIKSKFGELTVYYVVESCSNFDQIVKIIDDLARKPFLVFNEKDSFIFEGKIKDNIILYDNFDRLGYESPYSEDLSKGNKIVVNDKVFVYHDNRLIKELPKGFILNFGD